MYRGDVILIFENRFFHPDRPPDISFQISQEKIDHFKANGRISRFNNELFNDLSWFEVMYGQGLRPEGYHALADIFPEEELARRLEGIQRVVRKSVDYMPGHAEFIAKTCAANRD